jgi:uncharacterized protein with PhoU and TrkA domain
LAVIRGEQQRFDPPADTALHEGGSLIVERSSEVILKIKHATGMISMQQLPGTYWWRSKPPCIWG